MAKPKARKFKDVRVGEYFQMLDEDGSPCQLTKIVIKAGGDESIEGFNAVELGDSGPGTIWKILPATKCYPPNTHWG